MKIAARIVFHSDAKPESFSFYATAEGSAWHWPSPAGNGEYTGHTWRCLADHGAVKLCPLCDDKSRLVAEDFPACDHIEVSPVIWLYPDLLSTDSPADVEQMRFDHWFARAREDEMLISDQSWLERLQQLRGEGAELSEVIAWQARERGWLNRLDGPGCVLYIWAGNSGRVQREQLKCIQFIAKFYTGATCTTTLYLKDCRPAPLTEKERENSPAHLAQQKALAAAGAQRTSEERELLRQRKEVEAAVEKNNAELAAVREHHSTSPKWLAAKLVLKDKPKLDPGFLDYCLSHAKQFGTLPSKMTAHMAVQKSEWAMRAKGVPSESTVWRRLKLISEELTRRKLLDDPGKGPPAKPVPKYDPKTNTGFNIDWSPASTPEGAEPEAEDPQATCRLYQGFLDQVDAGNFPLTTNGLRDYCGEAIPHTVEWFLDELDRLNKPLTTSWLRTYLEKIELQSPSETLDEVERKKERTGATEHDTRSQELPENPEE